MNDLLRELAPISSQAWAEIDAEAKRTLKLTLAARRLVDFSGPLGWKQGPVEQDPQRRPATSFGDRTPLLPLHG